MTFDLAFEEELLSQCLQDIEFLKSAYRLLEAHHFSTPQLSWVWTQLKENWKSYAERMTVRLFVVRAERDFPDLDEQRTVLELVLKLFRLRPLAPKASLAELQRFVRFVGLQVAMEDAVRDLHEDRVDEAFASLRKATLQDLRPKAYKVCRWMEEFDARQLERKHLKEHPEEYTCIPTGLKRLDAVVTGMRVGELGLVVGTTGRGKSIFLNHLGYHAILHRYGVIHFSLEMPVHQVAARYDARFTMLAHRKFKSFEFTVDELRSIDARLSKMRDVLSGRLQIVSMPLRRCDINSVRNAIEEVRAEMPLHMVIVDSGDHMQALSRYDSKRLEQAEVYWDLKTLAEEEGLVVWSSTQAGREWESRTASSEAVSESYDKARIADLILSLNTPKDSAKPKRGHGDDVEDEEATGESKGAKLEAYLAKYRDGESKTRIPLDPDFSTMLIREQEESPKGRE
jgi:replicative DNA helicase